MAAMTENEISAGVVTYLNSEKLYSAKGVSTNVKVLDTGNRKAEGDRPFLIVEVTEGGECLCTPLLSKNGEGRIQLRQDLKEGPGSGWLERASYFSRFQFWKIPKSTIVSASSGEINPVGKRKIYAKCEATALNEIKNYENDSDTPYYLVNSD